MSKLTYKDKINIYNDRKVGLSIQSLANKYSMTTKNIQYMLCLSEKHGINILKKEKLYLKAELEYSKKLRAVVQARKNQ